MQGWRTDNIQGVSQKEILSDRYMELFLTRHL